ncbi:hypothetical protein [Liquorilactobacillus mali]|nr:hypothetical protein [Liquorilactobacillus mali]EJF00893.1 hypothetical protein LMA_02451 [Liquorilactobacillus mali KCTC 3596 = DSM 20444]QFQ74230.1 hypothetical protein LM596_03395 [Liquorilactobacillus mali]
MKLVECQAFEYALGLTKELLVARQISFETPKIVWKLNDRFLIGNTLRYKEHFVLSYPKYSQGELDEHPIYISEIEKSFLQLVRNTWFTKFDTPFGVPIALKQSNVLLFDLTIKLVSDLKLSGHDPIGKKLFNVSSMESKLALPFIDIKDTDVLEPVSLITVNSK